MSNATREQEFKMAKEKLAYRVNPKDGEIVHLPKITGRYRQKALGDDLQQSIMQFADLKPLLVLPKLAGEGQFGQVKFVETERGARYAVKVQNQGSGSEPKNYRNNELRIGKDVRLILQNGIRKYDALKRQHFLMPDLGINLQEFIATRPTLNERIDIAIHLSRIVAQHHLGLATDSGKKVSHRDIKPANIMIDAATKKVCLTDYGLAQYGDPTLPPPDLSGTPYYLPSSLTTNYSMAQMDNLALKRCIFMPEYIYVMGHGRVQVSSRITGLLSATELRTLDLYSEFYSGGKSVADHSSLLMGALLILGKNHHQSAYARLRWDQDLQKALYVAHYLKVDCYDFLQKLIDKPFMTREVSVFWPLVGKLQQSIMLDIWVNHDLVTLMQEISTLPHRERVKAIDYINEQAPTESTSLDQINNFRKQLRLRPVTSVNEKPAEQAIEKRQPHLAAEPIHKLPHPTKLKPLPTTKPHVEAPTKPLALRHIPAKADRSVPPLAEHHAKVHPTKARMSRAQLAELKHINRLNLDAKPPKAKLAPLGEHPSSYFSAPKKQFHSESSPTLPPAAEKPSVTPAIIPFSDWNIRVSVEKILVDVYTTIDAQQKNKRKPFSIYQTSNQRDYIDPGIFAAANHFNCVIKQAKLAYDFPSVMQQIKQYCSRELSSYSRSYRDLLLQKLKALIQYHDPTAAVITENCHSDEVCQWFLDRAAAKQPAIAARAII
jgi:serine/threonine protein kinase